MKTIRIDSNHKQIAIWLLIVCVLVFVMVVLGGVTRLTRSGLSIVEWDPIMGTIPPLSPEAWVTLFEKYKQTPEYQKVNVGMDLAGFKGIFWLEYLHRLLGRLIGFAFLIPFLYFLIRRRIDKPLVPKLITMFVLGGLQGLLGWLMVASGLVDLPRVSAYRLTAHLGLAVAIYAYILWVAMGLLYPRPRAGPESERLQRIGMMVTGLIFFMILTGGFVAGTRAGFVFNTFPLMNGAFFPPGMYAMTPWWANLFENVATVQFNHRLLAYGLCLVIPMYWWLARRIELPPRIRLGLHALLAILVIQVALGITTLLFIVPVSLAAAHQAGALLLFTFALFVNHALGRTRS